MSRKYTKWDSDSRRAYKFAKNFSQKQAERELTEQNYMPVTKREKKRIGIGEVIVLIIILIVGILAAAKLGLIFLLR